MKKNKDKIDSEKNVRMIVNAVIPHEPVIDAEKFSSWKRLLRVTAYVVRFISQCIKKRPNVPDYSNAHLSAEEVKEAEKFWILEAQK